jgi:hypothetical protein
MEPIGKPKLTPAAPISLVLHKVDAIERKIDIVTRIDNLLTHVDGINDERDSVPLLIGVRKAWPQVKAEIERLRAENERLRRCPPKMKR